MAEQTEYLVRLMEATYQRASTVVRTRHGRTEYLEMLMETCYQRALTVVKTRDGRPDRVLSEANRSHLSESINSSENKTWQKRRGTY